MSLLFKKKYSYEVNENIASVGSFIDTINKHRISEIASNFTGELSCDTFIFKPKRFWQTDLFGLPYNFCSLIGKLEQSGAETKIVIVVGPSVGALIVYYLAVVIFIQTVLRIDVPLEQKDFAAIFGTFLIVLFLWLNIRLALRTLVKRFEKAINVK